GWWTEPSRRYRSGPRVRPARRLRFGYCPLLLGDRPRRTLDRMSHNDHLADFDPDIAALLDLELHRQQSTLEMIASENFAPVASLEAQGSVLTNKYAEGTPGN